MAASSRDKGIRGEEIAADYLRKQKYQILHRNLKLSHLEIDLVCRHGDCLVFVEVKYSRTDRFGHPATWINDRKKERLKRAAQLYIEEHGSGGLDIRFDAVTIHKDRIEHYQNAFQ